MNSAFFRKTPGLWAAFLACGVLFYLILSHAAENQQVGHDGEIGKSLLFSGYSSTRKIINEKENLVVDGQIKNTSTESTKIPCLELTTFNGDKPLQRKAFSMNDALVSPEQSLNFRISLADPDSSSTRFTVEFTNDCSQAVIVARDPELDQLVTAHDEAINLGLIFRNYSSTREFSNEKETLVVSGAIENPTDHTITLPRLRLITYEYNSKLQDKVFNPPEQLIESKARVDFILRLELTDSRSTRFEVEFTNSPAI